VLLGLGLVVSVGDLAALAVVHRSLRADPAWSDDGRRHRYPIALAAVTVLGAAAGIDRLIEPDWNPVQLLALVAAVSCGFAGTAWLMTGRGRLLTDLAGHLRQADDGPGTGQAEG
jgi:hypothetical protein